MPLARVTEHSTPPAPSTGTDPDVEGDTETVKVSASSDPYVAVEDDSDSPVVVAVGAEVVVRTWSTELIHWATVREYVPLPCPPLAPTELAELAVVEPPGEGLRAVPDAVKFVAEAG